MKIIHQDKNYLIVEKEAGLNTLSEKPDEPSLNKELLKIYPQLRNVGAEEKRYGIMHRLDKGASGLIIVARNNNAFLYFKKLFQEKSVEKKYLALIWGALKQNEGEIEKYIALPKGKGTKRVALEPQALQRKSLKVKKPRYALTLFKKIKDINGFSLVEVQPITGRTHQIRAHFSSIGRPILGDFKYGKKKETLGLSRLFLHAYHIKFKDLQGDIKKFESSLPEELDDFIAKLQH